MHNDLKNQNVTWQSVSKTWLSSMRSHPLHPCLSDPNIYTVAFMEKFCTKSQLVFCEVTYWEICETGSSDSCWSCSYLRCSTSATSAFIKHLAFTKSAHSHRRKKWQIHFSNSAAEWSYLSFLSAKMTFCSLKTKKKEEPLESFSTQITERSLLPSMKQDAKEKKKFHQPSPSLSSLASSSSTTGASPDISPPLTLCAFPPPQTNYISRQIYWFLTRLSPPCCFRIITAPKRTSK